jgi:hypothetical protein
MDYRSPLPVHSEWFRHIFTEGNERLQPATRPLPVFLVMVWIIIPRWMYESPEIRAKRPGCQNGNP